MSIGVKLCLGCRQLGRWGRTGRCASCQLVTERNRERNPRRRAIKRARYNTAHRQQRQIWAWHVAMGYTPCARCGGTINPLEPWDLDHLPDGTSRPSHAGCNRAATTPPTSKETTR